MCVVPVLPIQMQANRLANLQVPCPACHKFPEPIAGCGLHSLNALGVARSRIAPLQLICDPDDLAVHDVLAKVGVTKQQDVKGPIRFQLPRPRKWR